MSNNQSVTRPAGDQLLAELDAERAAHRSTTTEVGFLESELQKERAAHSQNLQEKQDEADALRKALEHETQSHLDTCSKLTQTTQAAEKLAESVQAYRDLGNPNSTTRPDLCSLGVVEQKMDAALAQYKALREGK